MEFEQQDTHITSSTQQNGRANANQSEERREQTQARSFPSVESIPLMQQQPVQLMKFSRFEGVSRLINWWYSDTEKNLLKQEETVAALVNSLAPYENSSEKHKIENIYTQFEKVEGGTFNKNQYEVVGKALDKIFGWASELKMELEERAKPYGAYNLDLVEHAKHAEENKFAGETIKTVVSAIADLPEYMQTDKNKLVLKNSLIPGISAHGYSAIGLTEHDLEFAQNRAQLLLKNFHALQERILQSWKTLQENFGLTGELKQIDLTGSDYHNEGQQVAMIESTDGQKVVYKPRSTQPDRALSDKGDSVFKQVNELSGGELHLPTIHAHEEEDDQGAFSFVEFVGHVEIKTEDEIAKYYRDLGQLTVFSKVAGVTDLHLENIMAGSVPTIIDGETAFLPFVMESEKINATEIKGALHTFINGATGKPDNNYFYSPDEKYEWDKLSPQKRKEQNLPNFEAFVAKKRANDLRGMSNYWVEYLTGIMDGMYWLSKEKAQIVKIVTKHLETMRMTRVVPVATQTFRDAMRDYNSYLGSDDKKKARKKIEEITKLVLTELEKFKFKLDGSAADVIMHGLRKDFSIRDTPIFHYHPDENHLVFHEDVIGSHPAMIKPEELVRENIDKLLKFGSHAALAEIQEQE